MKRMSEMVKHLSFSQLGILGALLLFGLVTLMIFWRGLDLTFAISRGLGASFSWNGRGDGAVNAHVTNQSYSGARPAPAIYGIYWCKKAHGSGDDSCAPDFTGDHRSDETLTFQNYDLPVPIQGQSQNVVLPNVPALASKNCGRFQVDLGFRDGGGIIGGQVFVIGPDCPTPPPPPPAVTPTPAPITTCPYQSTQAQVQKDIHDPWGDNKSIKLGQSVRLGGFHNGTGYFPGDSHNNYQPNTPNVDFFITDPSGTTQQVLLPPYPISFTPNKAGTYTFIGKTRKEDNQLNPAVRYFSEPQCTDRGSITVIGPLFSPPPSPRATPHPSASPVATPRPTSSPAPTTTQLKLCKYEDSNGNGYKDPGENVKSWRFHYEFDGHTYTVDSHWWEIWKQGCASVNVPIGKQITVSEEMQNGWRFTALYADSARLNQSTYSYVSQRDRDKILWFLNTFTPIGGSPNPTPLATPTTNTQPECLSLTSNVTTGGAQLPVTFTGRAHDNDGIIKQMEYAFGDGEGQTVDTAGGTNADTVSTLSHTYKTAGTYYATLRVKDNSGQGNEWSSTPESCKVKITVAGEILGGTSATTLPKAGVSEWLTLSYLVSGGVGLGLKQIAKKLKKI